MAPKRKFRLVRHVGKVGGRIKQQPIVLKNRLKKISSKFILKLSLREKFRNEIIVKTNRRIDLMFLIEETEVGRKVRSEKIYGLMGCTLAELPLFFEKNVNMTPRLRDEYKKTLELFRKDYLFNKRKAFVNMHKEQLKGILEGMLEVHTSNISSLLGKHAADYEEAMKLAEAKLRKKITEPKADAAEVRQSIRRNLDFFTNRKGPTQ